MSLTTCQARRIPIALLLCCICRYSSSSSSSFKPRTEFNVQSSGSGSSSSKWSPAHMRTTLSALRLSTNPIDSSGPPKNKAKAIIQMRHESRRLAQRFKLPSNAVVVEVRDARLPVNPHINFSLSYISHIHLLFTFCFKLSSVASPYLALTGSYSSTTSSSSLNESIAASVTVIPSANRLLVFNKADLADSNRIMVETIDMDYWQVTHSFCLSLLIRTILGIENRFYKILSTNLTFICLDSPSTNNQTDIKLCKRWRTIVMVRSLLLYNFPSQLCINRHCNQWSSDLSICNNADCGSAKCW